MNTVDAQEIQNFSKDSSFWWDEKGPFKPLHRLNPVRLRYIKDRICGHFDRDVDGFDSYKGLKILDVGCGGGLVCEPMARLGGEVMGIDADHNAIEVAREHAAGQGIKIEYEDTTSDQLAEQGRQFDVVVALEIIEHVSDPEAFVKSLTDLCAPGGMIIMSTLNRTPKSYALGIVAAEYILRWVPRGTHHWKKFVKPSELASLLRRNGATPVDICGLVFSPLKQAFALDRRDLDVNYLLASTY